MWKCTNFFSASAPSWYSNSPALQYPVTTNVPFDAHTNMLPDRLSAMQFAGSDVSGNTYAYGTQWGTLRLTSNSGRTWIDLDLSNAVPNRFITEIVFDPNNANVLWLTLSGWYGEDSSQLGHVFKTTNALAAPTWLNVSPPVNIPHNTIVIDPINPNVVYVGTDIGVWKTTDGAGSWTHMGPEAGLPNVAVFELQHNEPTERLVAFTHRRGAFALVNTNAASLRLAQAVSRDPVAPGCDLTYALTVRNLGVREATDVLLTNALPEGTRFVSATASQGSCAQAMGVVTCHLGTVPALSNAIVTLVVTPLGDGLRVTNTVGVTANEPEASPWNNWSLLASAMAVGPIQPATPAVLAGFPVTFTAPANLRPQTAMQWQFNGADLAGATNAALVQANVGAAQAGAYTVVLRNAAGTFTSAPATLTVLFRPTITLHPTPTNQTVVAGDPVSLTVGASGTLPVNYGWRLGTATQTNIILYSNLCTIHYVAVATNDNLSTNTWRVRITNTAGASALTAPAFVVVLPDRDGDHIPDSWEIAYGLDPANAADGLLDPDGDSFNNLAEYLAGTDPLDRQSYLKIDPTAVNRERYYRLATPKLPD